MRRKLIVLLVAFVMITSIAFAAGRKEGPALGTEENPVIWSLVPSGETQAILTSGQQLADLVYEKTGIHVRASVATEYAGVIEALGTNPPSAHMASLATFAYILAADRGLARSELVAVRRGNPYYDAQIIAGADTGIRSIADLEGRSFARPDPASTSGWIIPMLTMRAAGIVPETDLTEIVDVGGHTAVVAAVYNGQVDAGATFNDARLGLQNQHADVMDRVIVLQVSEPIPNDGVQFSPSVPAEMRTRIVDALVEISLTDAGKAAMRGMYQWDGFERLGDDFYDPFRQVLQASGFPISDLLR